MEGWIKLFLSELRLGGRVGVVEGVHRSAAKNCSPVRIHGVTIFFCFNLVERTYIGEKRCITGGLWTK